MKEFNRVIFGATALSAGLRFNLNENDLVVEKIYFASRNLLKVLMQNL